MVLVGVALGKVNSSFFLAVDLATTRVEGPTIGADVDSVSKEDSVSDADSVSKEDFRPVYRLPVFFFGLAEYLGDPPVKNLTVCSYALCRSVRISVKISFFSLFT